MYDAGMPGSEIRELALNLEWRGSSLDRGIRRWRRCLHHLYTYTYTRLRDIACDDRLPGTRLGESGIKRSFGHQHENRRCQDSVKSDGRRRWTMGEGMGGGV